MPRGIAVRHFFAPVFPVPTAFSEFFLPVRVDSRCQMCYTWRLEETARYAAANGSDAFTSTLFYSIYQQHDLMRRTAEHFAEKYGVAFHYEDFRPGWQEGIDISHELDLYRQPYCGCIFSEEERYSREIRKQRKKENKAKKRARLEREAREAQAAAANS